MQQRDALSHCPPEILRQTLAAIFFTVEQEGVGGQTLLDLAEGRGGSGAERVVASVLHAQQVVQEFAHEKVRDSSCGGGLIGERGCQDKVRDEEVLASVCVL